MLLSRYSMPLTLSAKRSFATTVANADTARNSIDHAQHRNTPSDPSSNVFGIDATTGSDVAGDARPLWTSWELTQNYLYVFAIVVGGVLTVRYWYFRESEHFAHHRWQQEPYAFFVKKDDKVAEGWWPGRACQFLEFNCFAAAYDAADKLLQEKTTRRTAQRALDALTDKANADRSRFIATEQ